jgi:hypothetical protein
MEYEPNQRRHEGRQWGEGKGLTRVPKRLDWKRMYSSVTYNLPMRFDENLIPERRR